MRLGALLALLAVSAVPAACGGSDSGKSSSSAGSATSTVLSSADKAKVGSVIVDAQCRTLYDGHPLYRYAGDQTKLAARKEAEYQGLRLRLLSLYLL